jgi:hypothetical protein
MASEVLDKQEKRKQKMIQIFKSLGFGAAEGAIISGVIILFMYLISDFFIFGTLILWLIAGWLSSYFVKVNTIEIILVSVSGSIISGLLFLLYDVSLWIIGLITGLAILFWTISFITTAFLKIKEKIEEKEELT